MLLRLYHTRFSEQDRDCRDDFVAVAVISPAHPIDPLIRLGTNDRAPGSA